MLISLIIPVYNAEKYIAEAIESVLQQPLKSIEIILVNDGSTDNSGSVCKKYADEYENIQYIEQENRGASAARNVGMENASGEYIMFLDADDKWVTNSLNVQIEQILKSGVDVVMCSGYLANVDRNRYSIDIQLRDALAPGHQIFPAAGTFAACIYRAQMLKDNDISFDEGVRFNEDQVFKIKSLYAADTVRMTSQFLYIYCKTPTSITQTVGGGFDLVTVWEKAKEWFLEHGKKEHLPQLMQYTDTKITSRMLLSAKYFVQAGNGKEAMLEELKRMGGYDMLMKATIHQVMPYQKEELQWFQKDLDKFVRNARLEGLKIKVGRMALRVNVIRRWRDKKKYPITSI